MTDASLFQDVSRRIDEALRFADDTRTVLIGEDTLRRTAECFRRDFRERTVLPVGDPNTFRAAGNAVRRHLEAEADLTVLPPFLFEAEVFHADREHADRLRERLGREDAVPIAVGSGTVNDLVKLAAHECRRPYMVVGTAASVDGYTSFGASIDVGGLKQTAYCPAPRTVLIDMEVLRRAPQEMNAAGYADLLAKVPAGADWMLADFLGTEPIDRTAWNFAQTNLRYWLRRPEGIPSRDTETLLFLIEGLIMSGLAMQKAKTSRTASGAEHLFSHLWDNQGHTWRGAAPSHGFKVGIGTMATVALYERVLDVDADMLRARRARLAETYPTWEAVEKKVRDRFGHGSLGDQVLEQSRQKHIGLDEARRRLDRYAEHWEPLRDMLRRQLLSAAEIRDMLRRSEAPSDPEEIGIDRARLRDAYEPAQLIRVRYNVLDFVLESGLWDDLIPPLFAPGGFWNQDAKQHEPAV